MMAKSSVRNEYIYPSVAAPVSHGIRDEFSPFISPASPALCLSSLFLCFFGFCLLVLCSSDQQSLEHTVATIAGTHRGTGALLDRRQRDQGERVICAVAIPCIDSCWHFCSVSPGDVTQRLPLGLRRHFRSSGPSTWILVVHGYRFWPVEVVDERFGHGWGEFHAMHKLEPGFKVIFACEREWIFHTVILDQDDLEMRFRWSGQNMHRRELHPPHALWTSCLPSCVSHEETVLKFGYLHVPIVQPRLKFEVRLKKAFQEFDLEEMVIRMGDCVWNIPINDLQLDVQMFARFFVALDLSCLDFLLVLMLSTTEFRVVVFPVDCDIDRIYSWL
ncbi:hypothetical protein RHMOL_Rhmol10G0119700 [Rhododendron molle]|uniref:Uncharacterized protein n=1 Tax=Rhododendron molle TaxID=49168 RepID=A0ACC0M1F6_RHOML|nr:hypothetical protein RHMOL_Rhmol10G0119700 [Rhododendron molle]